MQDDEFEEQARNSGEEPHREAAVDFGEYAVIGTDIQIVLGGRLIAHPGD